MAYAVTTYPVPFGAIAIFRFVNKLEALRNSVLEWNAARVTHKALSGLSNAQLDDIGLIRADIGNLPIKFARY